MNVGDRVCTTDAWTNDPLSGAGRRIFGEITKISDRGPINSRRTHQVKLSAPFLGKWGYLWFDPEDLEVETAVGTRFLVVEIPPEASDDDAEALMDLAATAVYDYEPIGDNKVWDPFIYGWTFPGHQAVEVPRKPRRPGEDS